MKQKIVTGLMCLSGLLSCPIRVLAGSLDSVGGNNGNNGGTSNALTNDDAMMGDTIKNHRGASASQLAEANETLSPFTNFCGYIVGGAIALIFAGIFVITAADLLYIALPPLRPLLHKGGDSQGGGFGGQQSSSSGFQLISDEAKNIVASSGSQGGGDSSFGGMGGNNSKPKNVMVEYFKARFVFMILLVVSTMILTSSVLMGTGVNLAQWGIRLLQSVNNFLG